MQYESKKARHEKPKKKCKTVSCKPKIFSQENKKKIPANEKSILRFQRDFVYPYSFTDLLRWQQSKLPNHGSVSGFSTCAGREQRERRNSQVSRASV